MTVPMGDSHRAPRCSCVGQIWCRPSWTKCGCFCCAPLAAKRLLTRATGPRQRQGPVNADCSPRPSTPSEVAHPTFACRRSGDYGPTGARPDGSCSNGARPRRASPSQSRREAWVFFRVKSGCMSGPSPLRSCRRGLPVRNACACPSLLACTSLGQSWRTRLVMHNRMVRNVLNFVRVQYCGPRSMRGLALRKDGACEPSPRGCLSIATSGGA